MKIEKKENKETREGFKKTLGALKLLESEWKAKIAELDEMRKDYQCLIDDIKAINEALQTGKFDKNQIKAFVRLYDSAIYKKK